MGTIRLSDDFVSPAITKGDPDIKINQKENQQISVKLERVYDPEIYTSNFKLQPTMLKTKIHAYIHSTTPGYAHGQLSWEPSSFINGSYIDYPLTINVTDATQISDVIIPEGYEDYYINSTNWKNVYEDTNYDNSVYLPDLTGKVIIYDLNNYMSNNTSFYDMFYDSTGYSTQATHIDLSNIDTSKLTDLGQAFYGCRNLVSLNINEWDTSSVTRFRHLFMWDAALTSLNLTNWDVTKVTDMDDMFMGCSSLTSLDLSNWNTNSLEWASGTFSQCNNLLVLDISNWDTRNITNDYSGMINLSNAQYLIIGSEIFKLPLKSSNMVSLPSTCKILVPSALISTYQNATNWSAHASKFDAIENYNIVRSNGQVTVTPKNA